MSEFGRNDFYRKHTIGGRVFACSPPGGKCTVLPRRRSKYIPVPGKSIIIGKCIVYCGNRLTLNTGRPSNRVGFLRIIWLGFGFLVSLFLSSLFPIYYQCQATKLFAVGKSGSNAIFFVRVGAFVETGVDFCMV